jgi:lipopolysaccharide biosynthesis regulator YciM
MSKKSPVTCMIYTQDIEAPTALGAANRTIFDLTKAIEIGEVINLKASMTKEQAIALLKEKKELFDLGLIDEAEFQKIKDELTPIIVGK